MIKKGQDILQLLNETIFVINKNGKGNTVVGEICSKF